MPATELAALLACATAMAFTPEPNTTLSAAMAVNHGLGDRLPSFNRAMACILAVTAVWMLMS